MQGVRKFTEMMKTIVPLVEERVNAEIERYWGVKLGSEGGSGKRIPLLSTRRWTTNAAFVNCYDGPQQSVGYHTDQLTYLGPMTTIASLSLGVPREFRVKRVGGLPDEELREGRKERSGQGEAADGGVEDEDEETEGPIGIHLPHNSLLIMHAGMQEGWKHRLVYSFSPSPRHL